MEGMPVCVMVNIEDDDIPEETEFFAVTLEAEDDTYVEIQESNLLVTIVDDDGTKTIVMSSSSLIVHVIHCTVAQLLVETHTSSFVIFAGPCIALTKTFISVREDDGEVVACVRLVKPDILQNMSSFIIFTRDGTALGNYFLFCVRTSFYAMFHIIVMCNVLCDLL